MKQIALALAILSITFSQNAVAAQEKTKKDPEDCPQLATCTASWVNAKGLKNKDSYEACFTACPLEKEKVKECSKAAIDTIQAYNLYCRNQNPSHKIENKRK